MTIKLQTFRKYAELKDKIKDLQEEADELGNKVLAEMEKAGCDTLQEDFGTFSVVRRTNWEYSSKVKEKEMQYKTVLTGMKTEEQENGTAKQSETKTVAYRKYEEKE